MNGSHSLSCTFLRAASRLDIPLYLVLCMVREITQRFHLSLRKLYYNALKRPKLLPWVPLHVDPFDFWGDKRDLPTLLPFHVILFLVCLPRGTDLRKSAHQKTKQKDRARLEISEAALCGSSPAVAHHRVQK